MCSFFGKYTLFYMTNVLNLSFGWFEDLGIPSQSKKNDIFTHLEYWELWWSFHTPINHCAMCLPTWNTPCCYYRVLYCTISSLYSTVLYYCLRISIDSFIDQRDTYFFIPLFFCHYSFYIRELYLFSCIITTKGQLVSKCLFYVFNSPKKRTKQFDLRYHSSKIELCCSFFGRIEDT